MPKTIKRISKVKKVNASRKSCRGKSNYSKGSSNSNNRGLRY